MAQATVDFFKEDIILRAGKVSEEALIAIALRIEERAKINIVNNDQVDTGAMLNGIYAAWRTGSGYSAAVSNAGARGSGGQVLEQAPLPGGSDPAALVAGAMDYTIWQEYLNPFLYPAFVQTAGETGRYVETIAKRYFK